LRAISGKNKKVQHKIRNSRYMKYGEYLEQVNYCQLMNSLLRMAVNIINIRPCYPT